MRVLVTGGGGFVGAHLTAALAAGGDDVTVLDNLCRGSHRRMPDGVRFVKGDIRDAEVLREAMRGVERVYHLAAQSNVLGAVTDVEYSFTTNVVGTYNVLVVARDTGVARMVFCSSREAYGEVDRIPVAEDHALNPKNAYGASKVAGEVYCRAFQGAYDLDVSIVRLANVYGPGDSGRVIPNWLERASRGEDLELYGGEQVIDFVPVETVVTALRSAGETALGGQAVNVGSGKGTTLRELAARVIALPGASGALKLLPARHVEVTRFVADVSRMRMLLGIEPPSDPLVGLGTLWERMRHA